VREFFLQMSSLLREARELSLFADRAYHWMCSSEFGSIALRDLEENFVLGRVVETRVTSSVGRRLVCEGARVTVMTTNEVWVGCFRFRGNRLGFDVDDVFERRNRQFFRLPLGWQERVDADGFYEDGRCRVAASDTLLEVADGIVFLDGLELFVVSFRV